MGDYEAKVRAVLDPGTFDEDVKKLTDKVRPVKIKIDGDSKNTSKDIKQIDNSLKSANASAGSFGATLKQALGIGSVTAVAVKGIREITKAMQNAIQASKDFDAAITNIRLATGKSYTDASNLVTNYNQMGQAIGATTSEVADSAVTWLRQGKSVADTNTLIRDSMILSKVGMLDASNAATLLTSSMKGYNVQTDEAIRIIDKLTAVDAHAAVNAGGLAQAMAQTANTANDAGISMDKLIGYAATVGEVTQRDMSSVGNSLRTIFTRMRDIKGGKLKLIDDDGTEELLSDVETTLANVGIDLRKTVNEFDNSGDVLDALAEKWDSLSNVQQAALSKAFAGVRQGENFRVLMNNYDTARKYMDIAADSAGTAEQKFAAYADSIEAKSKSLQAAFEALAVNTISPSVIAGITDATAALVTFLDKTNLVKAGLAGLAAAGAIAGFTKMATAITSAAMRMNDFNTALQMTKAGNLGADEMTKLIALTNNLSASQLNTVLSSESLSAAQRMTILTSTGLSEAEAQAALASIGLAGAEGTATTATFSLTGAFKGLWATLMANPIILLVAGVTAAVSVFSTLKRKAAEAREAVKQTVSSFKEQQGQLRSNQSDFNGLVKRYDELSKGVNALGENVALTAEEYDEYLSVSNKIADAVPGMISGFDSQGNAILSCKDNVTELTDAYNDLIRAQNNVLINSAKDIFGDFRKSANEALAGSDATLFGALSYDPKKLTQSAVDALDAILHSTDIEQAVSDNVVFGSPVAQQIRKVIEDAGIKQGFTESYNDWVARAVRENHVALQAVVDSWNDDVQASTEGIASLAQAYVGNALLDGYENVTPTMESLINRIIGGYDFDFYGQFNDIQSMYSYLNGLLSQFDSIGADGAEKIDIVFDLQTKYNNGDCTVGEYLAAIGDLKGVVSQFDEATQKDLLLSLGFNDQNISDQFNAILSHFRTPDTSQLTDWLYSLSREDFEMVYSLSLDDASVDDTLAELQAKIEEAKQVPVSFDFDLSSEADSYENVINAIKKSISEVGLDSEQIDSLTQRYAAFAEQGYDVASLFETTENGIHLNTKALSELESDYEAQTKTGLKDYLDSLVDQYNDLTQQINETGDATGELGTQRDSLGAQIENVRSLAAQYEGLTSAYNKWKQAQSMGEEGDMYDDITGNLKNIKQLYDDGLVGTNKFRQAVQLMTNEDVSTWSADELVQTYEQVMPLMERYFTEGQQGTDQFLQDINKLNSDWAHMNEDGAWEIDFGVGGDKDVADALGISTESLQIILRKLKDFGADINLDSLYSDLGLSATDAEGALAEVNTKIEETKQALAEGTGDSEELTQQLEKLESAKETLETITGAENALELDTMTIDEAIEKITTLEQMMANGIELPITLTGQYDELNSFIQKYAEENNIPIDVLLGTSGTGKQDIEDTTKAAEELNGFEAFFALSTEGDAQQSIEDTQTSLTDLDGATAKPEIGADDQASPIVDDVSGKLTEVDTKDWQASVSAATDGTLNTVDQAIDSVANKPRTAFITVETVNPSDLTDEQIDEYHKRTGDEYSIPMLLPEDPIVTGGGKKVEVEAEVAPADGAVDQFVGDVQGEINKEPPLQFPAPEEIDGMYPGDTFGERASQTVGVNVEAEDPNKPIEQVQHAASSSPVQVDVSGQPLDTSDLSNVSSHISDLTGVARGVGGASAEVTELTNAYIALSEAQKQVNSVDVGDSGAVEAASSGLAQAAANFQTAYDNLQGKLGGEGAAVEVDADTEAALAKIRAIAEENPTATATMILDSKEVDDYSPKDKSASAKYTVDHSSIDSWTPPEKKGKVTYAATGPGNAKGTRNAVGGETLVDEDGAELIEHRNQGTFELGTNAGARLTELEPGDIVHTASETKSILKRVKGVRFFSGDAFSSGTYKPTQKKDDSGSGKGSSGKGKKGNKGSNKKSDSKDSDVFDWIEVLIERIESAIKSLGRTAESTFKTLATRTSAITSEIKKVNSEIKTQQKAAQKYFDYADKVAKDSKLSDSLKKKVQDGTLDITKYKGKTLDAIKEFQQWYEKGLSAQERAEELQEERSQLYQDRFDMIETDYDNQLSQIEHELNMFEKAVSMSDYTGADKPFKDMIKARQDSIKLLNKEAKALQKQLDKAVASGAVEEGSEAWYEMVAAIAAVKEEAADAAIEVAKLRREAFDDTEQRFDNYIGMIDSMLDIYDKQVQASEFTGESKPYDIIIATSQKRIDTLNAEADALEAKLKESMQGENGIQAGSQQWYEMQSEIIAKRGEAIDTANEIAQAYKDAFDDIGTHYDNLMSLVDARTQALNRSLDMLEARGYMGGGDVYRELQRQERENIDINREKLKQQQEALDKAVSSGSIAVGSDAWFEMQSQINDTTAAIEESEIAVVEYGNKIRELEWDKFDFLQDRISAITDETDFLIKLMDSSDLFDDKGQITDTGSATVGLHAQNYDVYMRQADEYAAEAKKINQELANDPANTKLIERREQLLKLQRDSILSANDEKEAVKSLVEEGIKKQIDSLKELVDEYKNSLDEAKSLYDYQKNISKQTKQIASLQKQLNAYSGDTSEENRARIQKLTVDLQEANEQLQETQYDQYLTDQKKLLDDLVKEYEDTLNQRLDNVDHLFEYMVDETNARAEEIKGTLEAESAKVGVSLSGTMASVWSAEGSAAKVVSTYASEASSAVSGSISSMTAELTDAMTASEEAITQQIVDSEPDVDQIAYSLSDEGAIGSGISSISSAIGDIKEYVKKLLEEGQKHLTDENKDETKQDDSKKTATQAAQASKYKAGDYVKVSGKVGLRGDDLKFKRYAKENEGLKVLGDKTEDGKKYYQVEYLSNKGEITTGWVLADKLEGNSSKTKAGAYKAKVKSKKANLYMGNTNGGTFVDAMTTVSKGETFDYVRTVKDDKGTSYAEIKYKGGRRYLKLSDIDVSGFTKGGYIADLQKIAYRNGDDMVTVNTLKKGEAVLTRTEAVQFKTLTDHLPELQGVVDLSHRLKELNAASTGNMTPEVNVGGITVQIPIEHVNDYNDFVRQLRDDKNFERMVKSFTVDPLTGGSSLAKKKYYH